jgi:hypothetical protein
MATCGTFSVVGVASRIGRGSESPELFARICISRFDNIGGGARPRGLTADARDDAPGDARSAAGVLGIRAVRAQIDSRIRFLTRRIDAAHVVDPEAPG